MGWSTEVHDSRVTTAFLQTKREARLRRAHKLPEPQGNSGPWPLAAVAGIVLSAVALQRDGRWQHAKSKLSQFCRQLQQRPQQVLLTTKSISVNLFCTVNAYSAMQLKVAN